MIGGGSKSWGVGRTALALALLANANAVLAGRVGERAGERGAESELAQDDRAARSPRNIAFTVPVIYNQRVLGDVLIEVDPEQRVRLESRTLLAELSPLLNDEGREAVGTVLAGRDYVEPADLVPIGLDLRFDRSRLALLVGTIPGQFRPVRALGREGRDDALPNLPVLEPADFSAYLNINTNLDYASDTDFRDPDFFLSGAARFADVVLEYDGAFTDQFGEGYRFYRRGVRGVYDDETRQRRYSAGDLRVASSPILRTTFLGGVSVEKGRRIFDPFLPVARLGGREIFLDNQSTVEVLLNGETYQTFQLDPGRYDLADLPVQLGANDIQLSIVDSAGRRQLIDYNFFFEPLDLPAGEEEYSLAVGVLARNLTFEPEYTDNFAATAFYRRALSDNLILGGGLQVSEDIQVAALTASIVPQIVPGAFELEAATSTGDGQTGVAVRANYRFRAGSSFTDSRQFSVNVDYESAGFQTLSDIVPVQFDLLSIGANYSQSLDERTYVNAGVIYTRFGSRQDDRTTVFADVIRRLNDRVRLTGGVEYGTSPFLRDDFGVRLGISVALGRSTRANADYRSRTETFRANLSRGVDDEVGSIGYDIGFTDTRGQTSLDASATYIGNRFDARVLAITDGPDIGSLDRRQNVRLQLGTSLAIADGTFGIGRPIFDSFAIFRPADAISDIDVVSGRNLSDNRYDARSGFFGGAVQNDLVSYTSQGVQYDVADTDLGIDIGDGVAQVDPPYRAGYAVTVGSAYYLSATGFVEAGGEPVALAGGSVRALNDEAFEPLPFFTNSAGRFAIVGLAPGGRYEVVLNDGKRFVFDVPPDTRSLIRLGTVETTEAQAEE